MMTIEEKYQESKLINLLANDSEYAFQLLYDRHRNRIYRLAVRYLKSPLLAQEVVQDVFLKLWFERKKIQSNKPLEAWLFTIAKNTLINRFKKITHDWNALHNYTHDIQDPIENGADSRVLNMELQGILHSAINQLPPQQKEVFHLTKEEGLSYQEVASQLHISPLTVKTHMSRALENMRTYLQQEGVLFLFVLFCFQ